MTFDLCPSRPKKNSKRMYNIRLRRISFLCFEKVPVMGRNCLLHTPNCQGRPNLWWRRRDASTRSFIEVIKFEPATNNSTRYVPNCMVTTCNWGIKRLETECNFLRSETSSAVKGNARALRSAAGFSASFRRLGATNCAADIVVSTGSDERGHNLGHGYPRESGQIRGEMSECYD